MKVVTTPAVREEAKYFCDLHKDVECFNEIKSESWYGSSFDESGITLHLCDECMKEFYAMCWNNYSVKPEDRPLI